MGRWHAMRRAGSPDLAPTSANPLPYDVVFQRFSEGDYSMHWSLDVPADSILVRGYYTDSGVRGAEAWETTTTGGGGTLTASVPEGETHNGYQVSVTVTDDGRDNTEVFADNLNWPD